MSAGGADTDRSVRAAEAASDRLMPFLLSIVAGLTDVTTFVLLGGVFSAHITGNVVVIAADLVTGAPIGLSSVLAVPCFIAIAAAVALVTEVRRRRADRWVQPLVLAQSALLIAAAAVSIATSASSDPHGPAGVVTALLAIAAMAVQNALLHVCYSRAPSVAVMTGNIVAATVAAVRLLRRRDDEAAAAWRSTWPLIVGFVGGCLLGALGCWLAADVGWVVAVAATVVVSAVAIRRARAALDRG